MHALPSGTHAVIGGPWLGNLKAVALLSSWIKLVISIVVQGKEIPSSCRRYHKKPKEGNANYLSASDVWLACRCECESLLAN